MSILLKPIDVSNLPDPPEGSKRLLLDARTGGLSLIDQDRKTTPFVYLDADTGKPFSNGVPIDSAATISRTLSHPAAFLNRDAVTIASGVGYGKGAAWKFFGVATDGSAWRYSAASEWVQVQIPGFFGTGTTLIYNLVALTANGNIFVSCTDGLAAAKDGLYRSADDGVTFTRVVNTKTVFGVPDGNARTVASLAETDAGVLFATGYGGTPTNRTLWLGKSTDAGVTWTNIHTAFAAGVGIPATHYHNVYFCPWRKLLFVSHGDAGTGSKVGVSDDLGVSFVPMTSTVQVTAITSDRRFLYFGLDNGQDRSIQRVTWPEYHQKASFALQAAVSKVYEPPENASTGGFAWKSWADNAGLVVMFYGEEGPARIITSNNYGEPGSWVVLYETTLGATSRYCHTGTLPTRYSEALWDGRYYSADPKLDLRLTATAVFPPGRSLIVDGRMGYHEASGLDAARLRFDTTMAMLDVSAPPVVVVNAIAEPVAINVVRNAFAGLDAGWAYVGNAVAANGQMNVSGAGTSRAILLPAQNGDTDLDDTVFRYFAATVDIQSDVTQNVVIMSLEGAGGVRFAKLTVLANSRKLMLDCVLHSGLGSAFTLPIMPNVKGTPTRYKLRLTKAASARLNGGIALFIDGELVLNISPAQGVYHALTAYAGAVTTQSSFAASFRNAVWSMNGDADIGVSS